MSSRNIELGIKTTVDTSGAKAAVASMQGVAEAGITAEQALQEASKEHAAAMAKAKAAADELFDGLGKIEEGLKDVAEAGDAANEQSGKLEENVSKITRAQKAQALSGLAQQVGQIGGKFREVASEVEEFDKQAADSLRKTAGRIDQVTSGVSSLALGFAAGGPIGAGAAALALGIGAIVNAFAEVEVAAIKAAAAEAAALEKSAQAARDAAEAAGERANALKSEDILNAIDLENAALSKQIGLLEDTLELSREKRAEAEEIAKAQDALSRARINEDEAKKKISPEQATQQRDAISREAELRGSDERKRSAEEDATLAEDKRKAAEADASKRDAAAAFAAADEDTARKLLEEKNAEVRARSAEVRASREIVNAGRPMTPMDFDETTSDQDVEDMRVAREGQERFDRHSASLPEAESRLKDTRSERDIAAAKVTTEEANRTKLTDEAETARIRAEEATAAAQKKRDKAARITSTVDEVSSLKDEERAAQQRAVEARRKDREKEDKPKPKPKPPAESRSDLAGEEGAASGRVDETFEGTRGSRHFGAVDAAKKKLEDGGSAEEYGQLAAEIEGFVNVITGIDAKKKADISALAKHFRNLSERVRKLESK